MTYFFIVENGVFVSYCNCKQELPNHLKQVEVETNRPDAYLALNIKDYAKKSREAIEAEFDAREKAGIEKLTKESEVESAKGRVLELIDDIKLAEELGEDTAELKQQLEQAKQHYTEIR